MIANFTTTATRNEQTKSTFAQIPDDKRDKSMQDDPHQDLHAYLDGHHQYKTKVARSIRVSATDLSTKGVDFNRSKTH